MQTEEPTFLNTQNLKVLVQSEFPGVEVKATGGGSAYRIEFAVWHFKVAYSLTAYRVSHKDKGNIGKGLFIVRLEMPTARPVEVYKKKVESLEDALACVRWLTHYFDGISAAFEMCREDPGDGKGPARIV
jgi:hypothetical protein